MVRLKEVVTADVPSHDLCFNSIVVRLKGESHRRALRTEALFQFHSGSIKSIAELFFAPTSLAFQFHSGSIKSGSVFEVRDFPKARFNSIVVRLKVWYGTFSYCE